MKSMTSTDAKNRFGQLLEGALVQPVAITRAGRPVAVALSAAEYHRLRAAESELLRRRLAAARSEA